MSGALDALREVTCSCGHLQLIHNGSACLYPWCACDKSDAEAIGEYIAALRAERDAMRDALAEVMSWIDNWEPDMTGDGEWSAAEERARAALGRHDEAAQSGQNLPNVEPITLRQHNAETGEVTYRPGEIRRR